MSNFKISDNGINLIKKYEGCYLKAYKCPAGVVTIGYGSTASDLPTIHMGMVITQEEADELLINSLEKYENAVNTYVTYPNLTQNQFDALTSFCYNCGCGALKTSTLLKYLNAGKIQEAADQFDLWVRGGGKVLPGLVRRRKAEKALFLKEKESEKTPDEMLGQAVSKIIKSGVNIEYNSWKRTDLMKLGNVPGLLVKLGGLDKLINDGIVSDIALWESGKYTVHNVRSLLIKYAARL